MRKQCSSFRRRISSLNTLVDWWLRMFCSLSTAYMEIRGDNALFVCFAEIQLLVLLNVYFLFGQWQQVKFCKALKSGSEQESKIRFVGIALAD